MTPGHFIKSAKVGNCDVTPGHSITFVYLLCENVRAIFAKAKTQGRKSFS